MPKLFKGPSGKLYFVGSSDEDTDPEEEARRDDFPEWERYRSARWGQADEGFEEDAEPGHSASEDSDGEAGDDWSGDDWPGGDQEGGLEQGEEEQEQGEDLKGGLEQDDQQGEGDLGIDYLIVMLLIEIFK